MNLGKTIYRLRTEKNMSQGDLADALGVSRQSVSKWENGNATPDLERLVKMAELFGVTLDEMVGRLPPENADGNSGKTPPQPVQQGLIQHQFRPLIPRHIVGIILVFFGFLFLPFALCATSYKTTVTCLILFAAFLLCGISGLLFRYPYIPCGWVLLGACALYVFLLTRWEHAYFSVGMLALGLAVLLLWTIYAHRMGTICVPVWLWWVGGIVLSILLILFCMNFLPPFWITSTSSAVSPAG